MSKRRVNRVIPPYDLHREHAGKLVTILLSHPDAETYLPKVIKPCSVVLEPIASASVRTNETASKVDHAVCIVESIISTFGGDTPARENNDDSLNSWSLEIKSPVLVEQSEKETKDDLKAEMAEGKKSAKKLSLQDYKRRMDQPYMLPKKSKRLDEVSNNPVSGGLEGSVSNVGPCLPSLGLVYDPDSLSLVEISNKKSVEGEEEDIGYSSDESKHIRLPASQVGKAVDTSCANGTGSSIGSKNLADPLLQYLHSNPISSGSSSLCTVNQSILDTSPMFISSPTFASAASSVGLLSPSPIDGRLTVSLPSASFPHGFVPDEPPDVRHVLCETNQIVDPCDQAASSTSIADLSQPVSIEAPVLTEPAADVGHQNGSRELSTSAPTNQGNSSENYSLPAEAPDQIFTSSSFRMESAPASSDDVVLLTAANEKLQPSNVNHYRESNYPGAFWPHGRHDLGDQAVSNTNLADLIQDVPTWAPVLTESAADDEHQQDSRDQSAGAALTYDQISAPWNQESSSKSYSLSAEADQITTSSPIMMEPIHVSCDDVEILAVNSNENSDTSTVSHYREFDYTSTSLPYNQIELREQSAGADALTSDQPLAPWNQGASSNGYGLPAEALDQIITASPIRMEFAPPVSDDNELLAVTDNEKLDPSIVGYHEESNHPSVSPPPLPTRAVNQPTNPEMPPDQVLEKFVDVLGTAVDRQPNPPCFTDEERMSRQLRIILLWPRSRGTVQALLVELQISSPFWKVSRCSTMSTVEHEATVCDVLAS